MRCLKLPVILTSLCYINCVGAHAQLIATKEIYVDHGDYADVSNPPCKNIPENAMVVMLEGLSQGKIKIPSVQKFVGTIVEMIPGGVGDAIAQTGGDIGKLYKPNRYANCGAVVVELPPGTTDVSFRTYAAGRPCATKDGQFLICDAGWSAWIIWQDGNFVAATFKNWSHNLARTAKFEVYGTVWPKKHVVGEGECLAKIAQQTYGKQDWPKIYRANKKLIKNPDLIFPKQELALPAP